MKRLRKVIVSIAAIALPCVNSSFSIAATPAAPPLFLSVLQSQSGSLLIKLNLENDLDPQAISSLAIFIDGRPPESSQHSESMREVLISDLPAGERRLIITGSGIEKIEEPLTILSGQQTVYTARLRRALVRLVVTSEPGARVSVNGQHYAEVAPSGRTGIISFPPAECVITLEHPDFESKSYKGECLAGDLQLEFKLQRKVFSPEFSDDFSEGSGFWSAPKGWRAENRRLEVRGAGIGLLKERTYKNFTARLALSLDDQKGAAWAVRAADPNNYYLFQLTGPAAERSNLLRTFIRQEGETRLLKSDPVIDDLSRPKDTIEIFIEAKDETIKHFIKVSSAPKSGEPEPLSILEDRTLSSGTFGLGAVDSEQFTVFFVTIIPAQDH
jgi:hypothetical protein